MFFHTTLLPGAALTGFGENEPLPAEPMLSVCAFGEDGPIALLLVSDDGKEARVSRLDVTEAGKITAVERVAHKTPHAVLAVAVHHPLNGEPVFLVLEAEIRDAAGERVVLARSTLLSRGTAPRGD